ncbi:hypothetical protein [Streptomyces sp. NRRL B-24484]|uniref:hypothetical protein n=1 Tax=Streptomyces sp. NRRL B-24484 TaxID=1463833 RepID=UPI0004C1B5C5|nr:hypothetical protein [Streptomyces sp. NRRL B-24484]
MTDHLPLTATPAPDRGPRPADGAVPRPLPRATAAADEREERGADRARTTGTCRTALQYLD